MTNTRITDPEILERRYEIELITSVIFQAFTVLVASCSDSLS